MNYLDILTAMWQGNELFVKSHQFGQWDHAYLRAIDGTEYPVPLGRLGEVQERGFVKRSREFAGPNLTKFVITDAGLAEIGKPTAKEMNRVSVFHGKESEAQSVLEGFA